LGEFIGNEQATGKLAARKNLADEDSQHATIPTKTIQLGPINSKSAQILAAIRAPNSNQSSLLALTDNFLLNWTENQISSVNE